MIVVVCPAAATTGGPEALHQLVNSLIRQGYDAAMLYLPGEYHRVPDAYADYNVPTISESSVYPTDTVVIPEVMAGEVARFAYADCWLWWLSVDNAPPEALTIGARHLAQSEYARDHLASHGITATMLTDYVHPAFYDRDEVRLARVAVNPAKGADLLARFRALHPDIDVVEITGKMRHQVADILNTSQVFVDFGHQPGRDRPPREAAMCGCVVYLREAGATLHRRDRSGLDDMFVFRADQIDELGDAIRNVLADATNARHNQWAYRLDVEEQRAVFDSQVAAFAALLPQE